MKSPASTNASCAEQLLHPARTTSVHFLVSALSLFPSFPSRFTDCFSISEPRHTLAIYTAYQLAGITTYSHLSRSVPWPLLHPYSHCPTPSLSHLLLYLRASQLSVPFRPSVAIRDFGSLPLSQCHVTLLYNQFPLCLQKATRIKATRTRDHDAVDELGTAVWPVRVRTARARSSGSVGTLKLDRGIRNAGSGWVIFGTGSLRAKSVIESLHFRKARETRNAPPSSPSRQKV